MCGVSVCPLKSDPFFLSFFFFFFFFFLFCFCDNLSRIMPAILE